MGRGIQKARRMRRCRSGVVDYIVLRGESVVKEERMRISDICCLLVTVQIVPLAKSIIIMCPLDTFLCNFARLASAVCIAVTVH